MARRKTGNFHMRVDPDNRALWDAEAQRQGMPLAMWLECLANREAERTERARILRAAFPQKCASGAPGSHEEEDTS
jgi:hypothetical protein